MIRRLFRALRVAFCRHEFSEIHDNSHDQELGHTVLVGCHCERCNIVLACSKVVCRIDVFGHDLEDYRMRVGLARQICWEEVVSAKFRMQFGQWWRFL